MWYSLRALKEIRGTYHNRYPFMLQNASSYALPDSSLNTKHSVLLWKPIWQLVHTDLSEWLRIFLEAELARTKVVILC